MVNDSLVGHIPSTDFDILYNEGISRESEIINLGAELGLIEKSGAWYSHKGEKIGQGKDNVRVYLKENPQLAAELEQQIRAELLVKKAPIAEAAMFEGVDE